MREGAGCSRKNIYQGIYRMLINTDHKTRTIHKGSVEKLSWWFKQGPERRKKRQKSQLN